MKHIKQIMESMGLIRPSLETPKTVILDGRIIVRTGGKTMIAPFKAVAMSPAEAAGIIYRLADELGMSGGAVSVTTNDKDNEVAVDRLIESLDGRSQID